MMADIPTIGRKSNMMRMDLVLQIMRTSIEGKSEEEIQNTIMELLAQFAPQILMEAMRFKAIWERETEAQEKFLGKGKVDGH